MLVASSARVRATEIGLDRKKMHAYGSGRALNAVFSVAAKWQDERGDKMSNALACFYLAHRQHNPVFR